MPKKIIGRREQITLPEWNLALITGKIDTGAYTSSIHAEYVAERVVDGKTVLFFKLLYPDHKKYKGEMIQARKFTQKKVKNSFGEAELRYKVTTKVIMFGESFEAEFTLTDRSKMRNAILLGRKILYDRFLVDVQQVNLSKKSKS